MGGVGIVGVWVSVWHRSNFGVAGLDQNLGVGGVGRNFGKGGVCQKPA